MKITVTKNVEVEVQVLHVVAGSPDWEDAEVNGQEDTDGNLIPCRNGDNWEPIIIQSTGQILNWTQGTIADIHYKIRDQGTYTLKDNDGKVIMVKDGYVPDCMCPGGSGYGDYIIMKVDKDGFIENWVPALDDFEEED